MTVQLAESREEKNRQENTPTRRLCRAVLIQGLLDLYSRQGKKRSSWPDRRCESDATHSRSSHGVAWCAEQWLLGFRDSALPLEVIASEAGIDPTVVRSHVLAKA